MVGRQHTPRRKFAPPMRFRSVRACDPGTSSELPHSSRQRLQGACPACKTAPFTNAAISARCGGCCKAVCRSPGGRVERSLCPERFAPDTISLSAEQECPLPSVQASHSSGQSDRPPRRSGNSDSGNRAPAMAAEAAVARLLHAPARLLRASIDSASAPVRLRSVVTRCQGCTLHYRSSLERTTASSSTADRHACAHHTPALASSSRAQGLRPCKAQPPAAAVCRRYQASVLLCRRTGTTPPPV